MNAGDEHCVILNKGRSFDQALYPGDITFSSNVQSLVVDGHSKFIHECKHLLLLHSLVMQPSQFFYLFKMSIFL